MLQKRLPQLGIELGSLGLASNAKLAQIAEHQTSMAEFPSSIPIRGNFLNDDFFCLHMKTFNANIANFV